MWGLEIKAITETYIMGVFGEIVSAGHHGCCSLLQLSQFLPSLIQSYPGTGKVPNHPRCSPLHALQARWARDVLGKAAGGFTSRCLTNYQIQGKGSKYDGIRFH